MKRTSGGYRKSIEDLIRAPWRLAAVLLIAALCFTNVYRAGTQSVSHDEAVMYEWMLSGSYSQVLDVEHGNHHVLTELMCKLMITLFGTSEIALRIPALLGGLLYFYSVFQISALLFGDAFLFLLSVALLSLDPLVLDYLSCARGYGTSLGFFFYALYQLIRYLAESPDPHNPRGPVRLLNKGGAALGLSIGCNPIMIFPGGALAASFLMMVLGVSLIHRRAPVAVASVQTKSRSSNKERRRKSRHESSVKPARSWEQPLVHFVLPTVVIGGFILLLPKQLIELGVGDLGPPSLFAIVKGLVLYSVIHSPAGFRGLTAWFPKGAAIGIVTYVAVPVVLTGLVALSIRILSTWTANRNLDALPLNDRFLLLLGGMLPLAIVLIVVSRYVFQQPYPELRTAMYWIPLLGLACLSFLRRLDQGVRVGRIFYALSATILVLCVVQFATQFNTRYFAEWAYCAAGKDMMKIVRADHAGKPGTRARIGATWQLEPVINFYRVAWGLDWIDPVYRDSPDNVYDYYLLAYGDTSLVERLHLKTLLSDPLSGTVLAKRAAL